MTLLQETIDFILWLTRIFRRFMSVRPLTTITVVSASGLSRITHLLAFFLPLKVVLLAGSGGIPSYFAGFIDPANKFSWVAGLTIGAFACYAITLVLDNLSRSLAETGSQDVLQGANELAVVNNRYERAQAYYSRFCGLLANFLFAFSGLVAIFVLNAALFLFLSAAMMLEFVFTAFGVRRAGYPNQTRVDGFIQQSLGSYLKLLASANFLGGFLVLLYPHLVGTGGNILIALLSIVIMRQLFTALRAGIRDSVALAKQKQRINALIFPNHQLQPSERYEKRILRVLFSKSGRRRIVASELQKATGHTHTANVYWTDTAIRGASIFRVEATRDGGAETAYQLQVYTPKHAHRLENEEFLFGQMSRVSLKAPEVITRFRRGPFECQLCEDEAGAAAPASLWRELYPQLLEYYWSQRPPKTLVKAYRASQPLLHQKLTTELLGRVEVGVDTSEEAEDLATLKKQRGRLQKLLAKLPLYVHNQDLVADNVTWNDANHWSVMCWGAWAVFPIGAVLPAKVEIPDLDEMLERLRRERADIPKWLRGEHLVLAKQCQNLEGAIRRGYYKKALSNIRLIVNNSVWLDERAEVA